jgi:hypothetical protein
MRTLPGGRAAALLAVLLALASADALAIVDEIQVYTDELDARGESGLELHLNTTPRGRKTPDYEGDTPPYRGTRITPEFSWGLGHDMDWGLYFPSAIDKDGNWYLGGVKPRIKWMPVHGSEEEGGWYAGANIELSRLTKKFAESPLTTELRLIGGYRAHDWLIGVNPIFEWNLSKGYRGSPDVELAWKAVHRVAGPLTMGLEYYNGLGTLRDRLPGAEQDRTLYLVAEVESKSWSLNFGVGHGLNGASDNVTVKAIVGIPFD